MSDDGADSDNVDRMNEYRELRRHTRNLRDNALEADDEVQNIMWIAAGGLGTGDPERLKEYAAGIRRTAEALEELADDVPDPREVREQSDDEGVSSSDE